MLHKIKAARERHGLGNPINASIVMLLTESLHKLAKQLADGQRMEDPYGTPEEDAERLLGELGAVAALIEIRIDRRLNTQEEPV